MIMFLNYFGFCTYFFQSVVSMSDQLKYFQEYLAKIKQHFGEEKVKFILEKSVFLVVSSSNDLAETYWVRSVEYDRNSYAEYLVELASEFIKVSFFFFFYFVINRHHLITKVL